MFLVLRYMCVQDLNRVSRPGHPGQKAVHNRHHIKGIAASPGADASGSIEHRID
ncbi:MAG: hypothetical protein V3R80_05005 [Candidatus Tectomicrobia bacterium]